MKTVAILSQKGGAGKTTLALHIAVAVEATKLSTVVIDLDPQASATALEDDDALIGAAIEAPASFGQQQRPFLWQRHRQACILTPANADPPGSPGICSKAPEGASRDGG